MVRSSPAKRITFYHGRLQLKFYRVAAARTKIHNQQQVLQGFTSVEDYSLRGSYAAPYYQVRQDSLSVPPALVRKHKRQKVFHRDLLVQSSQLFSENMTHYFSN